MTTTFKITNETDLLKAFSLLVGIVFKYSPNSNRNASNVHFGSITVDETFTDDVLWAFRQNHVNFTTNENEGEQ